MLASIQQIVDINPIPNADNIEVAKVLGWEVVVRKGEFKVGDLCVYIEIDTLIPNKSWSKFLFKGSHENDEYYRLRTIKLKGQISQGLILSLLSISDDMISGEEKIKNNDNIGGYVTDETDGANEAIQFWEEMKENCHVSYKNYIGQDVTASIGIKKYEKITPTINIGGQKVKTRNFPAFIHKTDEVRIQSEPWLLDKLKGKSYYITQKMDGTSATYYKYGGHFGVCSRNLELSDPRTPNGVWNILKFRIKRLLGKVKKEIPDLNIYWKMAEKYNIKSWLPEGYAIQGEICGPGIQENKMGLEENKLFLFNAWKINDQKYIDFIFEEGNTLGVAVASRNFENPNNILWSVPIKEKGDNYYYSLDELLVLSEHWKYENNTPQEGIVVRSVDQTISFKVINNDFLLKYKE